MSLNEAWWRRVDNEVKTDFHLPRNPPHPEPLVDDDQEIDEDLLWVIETGYRIVLSRVLIQKATVIERAQERELEECVREG
jgi:hypothetical protein